MKENLKTTTYRNGTPINNTTNNTDWNNYLTDSYLWYNNDIANKEIYGALYNIRAVTSTHGLCPAGWHVPSKQEFETMINSIGGYNNELKATGTQYWIPPNNAANNQSGFSARGSGIKECGYTTNFTSQKNSTYFWSSTYSHNINYGDISYPAYYAPFINHWANETIPLTVLLGCYGNPVRCIKD